MCPCTRVGKTWAEMGVVSFDDFYFFLGLTHYFVQNRKNPKHWETDRICACVRVCVWCTCVYDVRVCVCVCILKRLVVLQKYTWEWLHIWLIFAEWLYTGDDTIFREQCLTADLYTVYKPVRQFIQCLIKNTCFEWLLKTAFSCFYSFLLRMKTKALCARFQSFIHKNRMLE